MQDLNIIEFSLQTQVDFMRPCIKSDANLLGLTSQVSEIFGEFLDVQNVTLSSTDDLFGYILTLPMFKGSAEIILNAQSIMLAFKNGKNRQALGLMTQATCKLIGLVAGREIRQHRISFSCVASFRSSSECESYMKRFKNPEMGVTSGGIICFASGGKVTGELRMSIEKALGFDNAVFLSAFIATTDPLTSESYANLGERLIQLIQLQELNFILPS